MNIWILISVLGKIVMVLPFQGTNLKQCQVMLPQYSVVADRIYLNPQNKDIIGSSKRSDVKIVCEKHKATDKIHMVPGVSAMLRL